MRRIYGLVIYTLTSNGDLEGQWMNNVVADFQIENARRNGGERNGFVGTYMATWNDSVSVGDITATLTIQPNDNNQLRLNWSQLQNAITGRINTTYTAIGTVINNELVCSYIMVN